MLQSVQRLHAVDLVAAAFLHAIFNSSKCPLSDWRGRAGATSPLPTPTGLREPPSTTIMQNINHQSFFIKGFSFFFFLSRVKVHSV